MQRFNGQLINQFPNTINGNAAAGAQVTIRVKSSGALASLYAANSLSGGTLPNPLTADAKGYYGFYAPDNVYTLDVNIAGTPQLEIQLQDVADLKAQFDNAVLNAGYIPVGTFAAGCTISQANGVVSDGSSFWRWDGDLPKTVTAGSAPTPVGVGGWFLVGGSSASVEDFKDSLASPATNEQIAGFNAIQLRVVNGIKNLIAVAGVSMSVKSFYVGGNSGGGDFYYDPDLSKTNHNGGTIIAPEAIAAWDGASANIAALLTWSGSGSGCFVRQFDIADGVNASIFGMVTSKSGNTLSAIPDATAPMLAAINYCNSLYEEITSVGYFGATNIKLKLPKGFSKTSAVLPFLRGFDLESEGTTHFQCATNKGHAFMDCGTGKVLDFVVTGIKLQQYTTCYRIQSFDSDMTQWSFIRCGFRNVDLGIDTVSYTTSRSSILTLQNCKVSYGVTRLANSYCDMTHVIGGWYSHNVNSALIMFVGRLCVSGGIYVPVLPTIQNEFCWYQGELADQTSGGSFTGCRFGAEFGGAVTLYIKSNAGGTTGSGLATGNTQAFKFSGCQLSANNRFDPLNTGNSVRGVVVFNQFNNGGVNFDACTFSTDLGPANGSASLSRVVVDYNNVAANEAPNNFAIEFDDSSWRSANSGANRPASNNLMQYIGNSSYRSIYKGVTAEGHLIVGVTADGQKNKATFSIRLGPSFSDYSYPMLFDLDLGQLGSSTNNAFRNSRFAGYKCSIVGGRDLSLSQNILKIRRTLTYSHLGCTGMNVSSEIASMHFGTGDTGDDYIEVTPLGPNGLVDVTVTWGQLTLSADTGLAKITPSFNQFSRLLNGNNL